MGIADYIRRKKESFQDARISRQVESINKQNIMLERERQRQEKLAKAERSKEKLVKEVTDLKEYNAKVEAKTPSMAKKFATGLASAMNKTGSTSKTHFAKVKARERTGIVSSMQGSRSLGLDPVGRGLDFSSNKKKRSPFDL